MRRWREMLATALLIVPITAVLCAQATRLVGQDRLTFRGGVEGSVRYDSLVLTFGTEPTAVVCAEFRLSYGRSADPQTGTLELVITDGPDDATATSAALARKTLTIDEFAALGTSEVINLEDLNIALVLVESQRGGIVRRAAKWTGRR